MHAFNKLLGSAALGLILAGGLAAPAFAQKLDNKVGSGATAAPSSSPASSSGIDFGNDSSEWANDGECDDPRFAGPGMAETLLDEDAMHDATDCRTAYEAGEITFGEGDGEVPPTVVAANKVDINDIDFGDDSSHWAKDGECDDPRFTGTGSATELLAEDLKKDATDCRAAFVAGTVSYAGVADTAVPSSTGIDYGDDSSEWAKDGECDDPRFSGAGVANTLLPEDTGKDATDCRAAVEAGKAIFNGGEAKAPPVVFNYGDDSSKWANDGECDDPRFVGEGTNKKLDYDDEMADATDCKALEEAGKVSIRKVYTPEYGAGAPYDSSHIKFGDNSSDYADDEQCDDPRFEGPGAAITLLESDRDRDANDCKAAFEAGTITLIEGQK